MRDNKASRTLAKVLLTRVTTVQQHFNTISELADCWLELLAPLCAYPLHALTDWLIDCILGAVYRQQLAAANLQSVAHSNKGKKVKVNDLYSASTRSVSKALRYSTHCQARVWYESGRVVRSLWSHHLVNVNKCSDAIAVDRHSYTFEYVNFTLWVQSQSQNSVPVRS